MKALMFFIIVLAISCNAQVKSDYEGFWDALPEAVDYLGFWEELTDTNNTQLADSIDWNAAGLTVSFVATDVVHTKQFNNDGKYLRLGIVARNASGVYGMMRVSGFFKKGTIPGMIGSVGIRKK